jgi:catechol 2,3-dioxygenase-like lactoylglutathione lyase family enzyme
MLELHRTNTILYCQQWEATAAFYRDTLGLPATFANDWFVEFALHDDADTGGAATGGAHLSIANAARASIAAVGGQGITLAWQVEDLAAVRGALQAAGVAVTPIKRRWGAWVCYCHDPEGHRIELWAERMEG